MVSLFRLPPTTVLIGLIVQARTNNGVSPGRRIGIWDDQKQEYPSEGPEPDRRLWRIWSRPEVYPARAVSTVSSPFRILDLTPAFSLKSRQADNK